MNKFILACVFALATSFVLISCSTPTTSEQTTDTTQVASETETGPTAVTVCTWNELNVRDTPSEKGKYLTSIYLNEPVTLTGDTASEKSGSKMLKYHRVKLSDGKLGWVRDEFIGIEVFPAAVLDELTLHKRPDITTVTEKKFYRADYVVAKESAPGWYEVTGKPAGEKWFVTGYVQRHQISLEPVDAQYAALYRRSAESTKPELANVLNTQLADESIFGASSFFVSNDERNEDSTMDDQNSESEEGVTDVNDPIYEEIMFWYSFVGGPEEGFNGFNGEVHGAKLTADPAGRAECAYYFDGQSYIGVPDALSLQHGSFTVGALFKAEDMQSPGQTLISQGRSVDGTGFALAFQGGQGNGRVTMGFVGLSPQVLFVNLNKPANNNWVFAVATYDGMRIKMYINGELAGEQAVPNTEAQAITSNLLESTQPIEIGRELESLGRYFKGVIDQVFMFNRVLSADEVRQMSSLNVD